MTYEELKNEATQRPWKMWQDGDEWCGIARTIPDVVAGYRFRRDVATMPFYRTPETKRTGKADATLVAHCVNNFDRALTALRQCRQILDSEYPVTDERHPANWLDETITRLETVA